MKKPPNHPPSRVASTADLHALQRFMAHGLIRPLTSSNRTQPRWSDGRPAREAVAEFVKPNDRLTSLERFELYNRMYWFRIFDAFRSDCPGLAALLGERRFWALAQAYLAGCPSQSFTLRNLCSRLESFIVAHPALTAPRTAIARDIARFEWAQTLAFDGPSGIALSPSSIAKTNPSRLRLGIQPYVSLLKLNYPIDEYVLSVKKREALRSEASNAPEAVIRSGHRRRPAPPRRQTVFVAVHRLENQLYQKRLEPQAFKILEALCRGRTLSVAIAAAGRVDPAKIQVWFTGWMAMGWFCRPVRP